MKFVWKSYSNWNFSIFLKSISLITLRLTELWRKVSSKTIFNFFFFKFVSSLFHKETSTTSLYSTAAAAAHSRWEFFNCELTSWTRRPKRFGSSLPSTALLARPGVGGECWSWDFESIFRWFLEQVQANSNSWQLTVLWIVHQPQQPKI